MHPNMLSNAEALERHQAKKAASKEAKKMKKVEETDKKGLSDSPWKSPNTRASTSLDEPRVHDEGSSRHTTEAEASRLKIFSRSSHVKRRLMVFS